jgi:hypothetical protein
MGVAIGNLIGIVLTLAAVVIAIKALFFVLGLVGLLFGVLGLLLKLAVIGGMLYLGWLFFRKISGEKQTF